MTNKSLTVTLILFFFVIFSLFSSSSSAAAPTSATLLKAAAALSNSGYLSMSLTLQLVVANSGLDLASPTATVFAPPDSAFLHSGQPSLPLLQYHIVPKRLSVKTLTYLPRGAKIQTLLANHTLAVTAAGGFAAVNGVRIDPNSVLDDGSVVIYGIDRFFTSDAAAAEQTAAPAPPTPIESIPVHRPGLESFGAASDLLVFKGCSIFAAFLAAQLVGFNRKTALTVFAPFDGAVEDYVSNTTDYSLIFREHVVPRLLTWQDLADLEDGSTLPTFEEGFLIDVAKSDGDVDVPVLNGVHVADQDMYRSRFLIVHGLNRLLTSQREKVTPQEEQVDVTMIEDQYDGASSSSSTSDQSDGFVGTVETSPRDFGDDYH